MASGDGLFRDVRQALRTFGREPSLVLGVVATFGLAIGVNAAMAGLVRRLMLAPPPGIAEPAAVVRAALEQSGRDGESFVMTTTSFPVARAIGVLDRTFVATAAVRTDTVGVGRGADLEQVAVVQASGDYFRVLASAPVLGRFFGPADDELPIGSPVVVLGHGYWTRRFARERSVIGREITINGEQFTVIGVAPRGFHGDGVSPVDLYMPLTAGMRARGSDWIAESRFRLVSVVARLAPGVSAGSASRVATTALVEQQLLDPADPLAMARFESIVPGAGARQSPRARIALWLSGVALVVLLVASANVGTLLLLRSERRRRDIAVRLALGASRGVIARQVLVESVLLALLGAVAGVLLARWFGDVLRATLLPDVAPDDGFVDPRLLAISLGIAAIAGVVAGLAPLARLGRRDLALEIRTGGGHGASARMGMQRLLVGIQVALCTVLLVGAGLFVRSLQRVQSQELGFSTRGLLHVTLDVQGFLPAAERDRIHHDAVDRLRRSGTVRTASVVQAMPFGNFHVPPISIPGTAGAPNVGGQLPFLYGATPEYLAMMGVTLREGRLLTDRDARGTPLVVLVNETMARTAWPGQSAIGKCIRAGHGGNPNDPFDIAALPCREVVGVVRDSRARSLREDGAESRFMQYYVPFGQLPTAPFADAPSVSGLLVQVNGEADAAIERVRRFIQGGSAIPLAARVRPYQALIDPQLRSWRLGATLFSLFGALALGIAAVGLFGVLSYLVAQRTRELGVRLALGASAPRLWRLLLQDALRLVLSGLIVGTLAAVAAAPLVRDLLFDTSPLDPGNLAMAVVVLLGVSVLAALRPAWRAGRVDPLVALRSDG